MFFSTPLTVVVCYNVMNVLGVAPEVFTAVEGYTAKGFSVHSNPLCRDTEAAVVRF